MGRVLRLGGSPPPRPDLLNVPTGTGWECLPKQKGWRGLGVQFLPPSVPVGTGSAHWRLGALLPVPGRCDGEPARGDVLIGGRGLPWS